jgi:autotransporter translocation and assembly factor TamB
LVIVVPIALVAWIGTTYVAQCLDTLAAPGVPIEFRYKARTGGEVVLRSQYYRFDWRHGDLTLGQIRVIASDRTTVANLDSLAMRGINLLWGGDQVIDARAKNLQARLVRLKGGRFEIEDLLPQPSEQPSRIPFKVQLDEARVLFVDRAGTSEWRKPLLVTDVRVEGLGDDWIATAGAYATGIGRVTGRIQSLVNAGLSVSGRTGGLELAPILEHLKTTPERRQLGELAKASFGSLRVTGPFALFLPTTGELSVESRLKATAKNFRFERYHADLATFDGLITRTGAKGKAFIEEGPSRGAFDGSVRWEGKQQVGGNVRVSTPDVRTLPVWVRETLPPQLSFQDGVYQGWVTVLDGKAVADGALSARWLRIANEEITRPEANIHFDSRQTIVRLVRGDYMGRAATGVLVYNFGSRFVTGAVSSTYTTLEPLVAKFPQLKGLTGEATLSVAVRGTSDDPIVDFEARGSGVYSRPGWQRIVLDRFDVTGVYRGGKVAVTRGVLQGPMGTVTALGNVSPSGSLSLDVIGRDLNLGVLDRRLAGSANLNAKVAGTVSDPQARGRLEIYNAQAEGQSLTAAAGNFVVNRRRAVLNDLNAYRGAANLTGDLEYRFANQGIAGELVARNFQLEDLLGPGYVGSLDSDRILVSGTLARPVVRGTIGAKDVVVQGIKIESATTQAALTGDLVSLAGTTLHLADGQVEVDGSLDVKTRKGRFTAKASGLDLNKLAPLVARYATLNGTLSGEAVIDVDGTRVASAQGTGRLDQVIVNETPMGSGPWELAYNGGAVTGSLDVGFLDRFVSLSDLNYDPNTGQIAGRADLFSFKLVDLVGAALPSLPRLSFDNEQRLRAITGVVNLGSTFSGTLEHPRLDVEKLEATELAYRKTDFGSLTASLVVGEGDWNIRSLALAGPVGNIQASGSAIQDGEISLTGDVSGLDVGALSVVDARLARIGGQVDLSFVASGQTNSPVVRASLTANRLFAKSAETPTDETLRLMVDTIEVSEAEGLHVQGNYFYRGFQGTLFASAPIEYPLAIGGVGQVEARATLARRDLKEIAGLVQGIDPAQTSGYVEGNLAGSGTIDNFLIDGEINLHADTLGFEGTDMTGKIDTSLRNVLASVNIGKNQVRANLQAESARGGSLAAEVFTDVEDFRGLAEGLTNGATRTLLDNDLGGKVTFSAFHGRQGFVGDTYVDAVVDGTIDLGGTIQAPRLTGTLDASNADTVLPFFEATSSSGAQILINPSFDLRFALANPARIRTVTADLRVNGEGSLSGTLSEPNLSATMLVDRGTVRFPASTVRLDQGGAIELRYRVSQGEPFASLDVELQGHTALTALRYDDVPERYEIVLELRGDLLKEGGLNLVATSDPPDLTQERILTLLGSVDLLTSFISSDQRYGTEERFRGALIGYALPVVFDPFTSRIASALGLEYLNLEYNQFEQATIAFAKALTPEFILQGRRQVSSPAPGFREQYDLRLVYRPRRLKGFFRRFSLSVGTDQDRPWKIALESGTRF